MNEREQNGRRQIRQLLDRVRARWRRIAVLRGTTRAGLAVSGVLAFAFSLTVWTARAPLALGAIGVAALAFAVGALTWGYWHARRSPSDAEVARLIEERDPSLDDRLASAVDLLARREPPGLAGPLITDAGRRASAIPPSAVLSGRTLRRAWIQAAGALALLGAVGFSGRQLARQSFDALALTLFPSRVALDVTPGSTRLEAGTGLVIEARLRGNSAPVVAKVLRGDGDDELSWDAAEMAAGSSGAFTYSLDAVASSFKYRVTAGMLTSPVYEVTVVRPPRVVRIDAEYTYPSSLGLPPRTEEDGGDIYAPAGTAVRLRVRTDRDVSTGQLALGGGGIVALTRHDATTLSANLTVTEDGTYRVALADDLGIRNPGDTEYFIRVVEDRPPEVRILRPARDRTVTMLEEVDVEVEGEDDFGLDRLELVYAIRGGPERAIRLPAPGRATAASGVATIYLEDLGVKPGDFVSYYARARDLPRGKRASETRSDIFFLEVRPFEQAFTLSQSQAQGGGGGRQLDDLVSVQKEIIVATWKVDRRAEAAAGAKPAQDIRSIARAEAELKTRVEQTSSAFRTSAMRDPRAGRGPQPGGGGPRPGRGGAPPDAPRAAQATAEEDAMTSAAAAMGKAVESLDRLKTGEALPAEMEALDHLLRAQADVKQREVARDSGSGAGGNRASQDLSSLFDRELQRQQQTNYETPTTTEQRRDDHASALDDIKELARRQDELLRRQRDLARERGQMTAEELKRELEKLTRDQNDLRQRAEELAGRMARDQGSRSGRGSQPSRGSQSPQGAQGSQSAQGSQGARGSQTGQRPGESGSDGSANSERLRAASEEMRGAAGDLRRQDPAQASARGERALERLRELERQLQASAPDERRRARGDLQHEARQLADAQQQLESELNRAGQGEAARDAMRRLAGEQERLADRARALQQGLGRLAGSGGSSGVAGDGQDGKEIAEASREFDRQRVADRMRQASEDMRAAGAQGDRAGTQEGGAGDGSRSPSAAAQPPSAAGDARRSAAAAQREAARALDALANRLAGADATGDATARRMSGQLARAQDLRERLDELSRELERMDREADGSASGRPSGATGRPGQGSAGGSEDAGLERLREEYVRKLRETRELLDEVQREDGTVARGGPGFTFEGQGMVLSAPGTESFKQDFTRWEALRRQATQALEHAESSLSIKLQAVAARDRLAAGVDDKPPAQYQQQVDSYFKALAAKPGSR